MIKDPLFFVKPILLLISCFSFINHEVSAQQVKMVDAQATAKTQNLYQNLFKLSKSGMMFGHQDDLAYGVGWWNEADESDVKRITGKYPAVFGWDLGVIETGRDFNIDTVDFKNMRKWIKKAYKMGSINTISWHLNNPVNGANSWDKTPSVKQILPGGEFHVTYVDYLDKLADFIKKCKVGFTPIPIVFRPFHEHNGNWFWWGKGLASEEDYIQLYRFTVSYLRDERNIHQLIYAYSPDRSRLDMSTPEASYFYGYPGDDYVDVIGLDNYWDVGHGSNNASIEEQQEQFKKSLELINKIAQEKEKVAALTETGSFGVKDKEWFSKSILEPMETSEDDLKIAWMLVWRNRFKKDAFTPYADHPAVEDFQKFEDDDMTLFSGDIQNVYKNNKPLIK